MVLLLHLPTEVLQPIILYSSRIDPGNEQCSVEMLDNLAQSCSRLKGIVFDTAELWRNVKFPAHWTDEKVKSTLSTLEQPLSIIHSMSFQGNQHISCLLIAHVITYCTNLSTIDILDTGIEYFPTRLADTLWLTFADSLKFSQLDSQDTLSEDKPDKQTVSVLLRTRRMPFSSIEFACETKRLIITIQSW